MAEEHRCAKFYLSPARALFVLGDSRAVSETWQPKLVADVAAVTSFGWEQKTNATAGVSLETYAGGIAARIASYNLVQDCSYALINLGINNIMGTAGAVFDEATNKASMQTIINAIRARWPSCSIYLTKVWARTYDASCNTFASWVDDLVALNSNVHVGLDERVTVKAGDNGGTNTSDGIHYSAAGDTAVASAWQTVLGFP